MIFCFQPHCRSVSATLPLHATQPLVEIVSNAPHMPNIHRSSTRCKMEAGQTMCRPWAICGEEDAEQARKGEFQQQRCNWELSSNFHPHSSPLQNTYQLHSQKLFNLHFIIGLLVIPYSMQHTLHWLGCIL